jgi:2-polyprenyl-3-methyl-5-hydroxy-6-metoxy-1,4-benzoquinol methylase
MSQIYKFDYNEMSVYGHVVRLLRNHATRRGVVLDLGCGYGAIAEPVRDDVGLTYIGIDGAPDGLAALRERGFETHRVELSSLAGAEAEIERLLAGRPLAAVTCLDTLEHLVNGFDFLRFVRRLADRDSCALIVSVPNVAHSQIAVKLLLGRWEMTETGLLDQTHVAFYTADRLRRFMEAAGWREVEVDDYRLEASDQLFPSDALPLLREAPIGRFLRRIVDGAHPHAAVNQFVRAYLPASPRGVALVADRVSPPRHFLTVILATRGAVRLQDLQRILNALAAQTCDDFEVSLVSYAGSEEQPVRSLLAAMPLPFQARATVLRCDREDRAAAFNAAIPILDSDYAAFLDDDTLPSSRWIETFRDMAAVPGNPVLEVACHDQDDRPIAADDLVGTLFGFVSPLPGYAFPLSVFRDLGLHFDASLSSAHDRDFIARAGQFCPRASRDTATVMVRQPGRDEAGQTEWLRRIDSDEILLPPGAAARIERMQRRLAALERERRNPLGSLLATLAERHQDNTIIGDLARSHLSVVSNPAADPTTDGFFLTVVTRTRGTRIDSLREMLLCLGAQDCQDFEVILVLHKCAARNQVVAMVDEFPASLRLRIQIVTCEVGERGAPLNVGVARARGSHVAFLDDDDLVLAHWVETFKAMAVAEPGKLLRAVCARQDAERGGGAFAESYAIATSWFTLYPASYELFDHLTVNQTPFLSLCFPAFVFRDWGFRFDETLTTTEDWALTTRAALLCGVHCDDEPTSIYRWWTNAPSSMTEHDRTEWDANRRRVIDMLDSAPLLLPAGFASRITGMLEENRWIARQLRAFQAHPLTRVFRDAWRRVRPWG